MNNLAGEKVMKVSEVANSLNLDVRTIQVKVKELFPEIVRNGYTTYLTEFHVTKIKLDLEKKFGVKTDLEKKLLIQQAMNFLNEEITDLRIINNNQEKELIKSKQLIITQTPKAEFFDHVTKSDKYLTLKTVSDILDIPEYGRNNLCKRLRELGYLTKYNQSYRKHQNQGLFKSIFSVSKSGKVNTSTVVSQKGLIKIRKVLLNPKSRNTSQYRSWKHAVLYRDHFKCVRCGCKDTLEAHHIIPWAVSVDKRYDKTNGQTLCHNCHLLEHKKK